MNSMDANTVCPDCGESSFYTLADKRLKCRQCSKKFTPSIRAFRIDEESQARIISLFLVDASAENTAQRLKINRKTIQKYYRYIRRKIARDSENFENTFFFHRELKTDNQQQTTFCVSSHNERIFVLSKERFDLILKEGHSLPLHFFIEAVRKKNTRSYEVFIRQGTAHQTEIAFKFKSYFLKASQGININNFNSFYYQLKEIEYKYNIANKVNGLIHLESIIN